MQATIKGSHDAIYDVIVVGYGFAGAMAAIAAHDQGASVVLIEKAPHFGGNSILSGGGCVTGEALEPTLQYLTRTSDGTTSADVLEAFAQGMVELPELLKGLAAEAGFEVIAGRRGGSYPFPGSDQLVNYYVTRNPRYKGFSWVQGTKAGATLMWVLSHDVEKRNIPVLYESPATQLLEGDGGVTAGVEIEQQGIRRKILARRAVILCTGGFEHNTTLISHYMPVPAVASISPLTHTGDGILMAQKAGAALWHMWLVHGGYGFRIPGLPVALRHGFDGFRDDHRKMPWIAVDRFGRRFMNEYPLAPQDTPIRALEYYDPDIQDFPRIPCYLIFDDDGRSLGPVAEPKVNDPSIQLSWSADNLAEVELGYILKNDTIHGLAEHLGMDGEILAETVDDWNRICREGRDKQFHRPVGTMMPLSRPPYFALPAYPIISNTQGGPVHNARQQVLDPFGRPIPHLYAAGELGSVFGHLYMLGGNLSECFIGGKVAGEAAAQEASLLG